MNIDLSPRFQELVHEQIGIITTVKYPEDAARWFNGLIEKMSWFFLLSEPTHIPTRGSDMELTFEESHKRW